MTENQECKEPKDSTSNGESPMDLGALAGFLKDQQKIPSSTYRLQLSAEFGFREAESIVPYLHKMGIGACYCSPYFQARPGTKHGYDICNHQRLHEELGSGADFLAFCNALANSAMGHIVDFVPNHMGVDPVANDWWRDVLENGPSSAYSQYFDIQWDPVKPELRGKILLPFLADHYGVVLERGDLQLAYHEGRLIIRFGELHFPIDPKQYPRVLHVLLAQLTQQAGDDHSDLAQLKELIQGFYDLPGCSEIDQGQSRRKLQAALTARLRDLVQTSLPIKEHLDGCIQQFNGQPGDPQSFDALHELLEAQPYRLAYWKAAHDEINYRRFFHIHELGGLRMEDSAVFHETHDLLFELIQQGLVTGVRLDHLDGLFDPAGYLTRFQEEAFLARARALFGDSVLQASVRQRLLNWRQAYLGAHGDPFVRCPFYLLAEKILASGEVLPEQWPLHGTTGYDFLNELNRLFVDPSHQVDCEKIYIGATGEDLDYGSLVENCKRLITQQAMASELKMLSRELNRISELDRRTRDFTLDSLREAIREVVVSFSVYRTYIDGLPIQSRDREIVHRAVGQAMLGNPAMSPAAFEFVKKILLLEGDLTRDQLQRQLEFTMKFQQYTGPVEAKGVEDTAFYRYNVLLSLNEVGGSPTHFGSSVELFHRANGQRRRQCPGTMLSTATHDTKRGEDTRARINVLSEIPQQWEQHFNHWRELHAPHRVDLNGQAAPSQSDEYAFYQSLIGVWPIDVDCAEALAPDEEFMQRMREYFLKSTKEACRFTGWMHPNASYDAAIINFCDKVLSGWTSSDFFKDFVPFQRKVACWGMINSLAQLVLKIISPGVPDFYQGSELWDLSLVDPDNRRPVDYSKRMKILDSLEPFLNGHLTSETLDFVREMIRCWPNGQIKQWIMAVGLCQRRKDPDLFLEGDYVPLYVIQQRENVNNEDVINEDANKEDSNAAEHIVAAARIRNGRTLIGVVPRMVTRLTDGTDPFAWNGDTWQDCRLQLPSELDAENLRNLVTGETVAVERSADQISACLKEILRYCPVAFLAAGGGG
jgi:(1->4)-alpha-D-glucan 1-alpha-D-glucosylmutase